MIDGLYLSSFFDFGPLKNVLDVRLRHDHGAALWELKDGNLRLRRYWEFERLSGLKQHQRALYDLSAARRLLGTLLSEEGVHLNDLVEIWGTPGLETSSHYQGTFGPKFAFHGMAHLMTALFSPSDAADCPIVAMSLDGAPDTLFERNARARHYYPGCVIDSDGMRLFPCESPGRLWSYAKTRYGLREGTLMALASASDVAVNLDARMFDEVSFFDMETRISAPRIVETVDAFVADAANRGTWLIPPSDPRLSSRELHISAAMKVIAEISLRVVQRNLERAERHHGADTTRSRLALAGGFALNCPTNSQLIREMSFKGFQIPPCASDSGIALGTGLAAFFPLLHGGEYSVDLTYPYCGQGFGDLSMELDRVRALVESVEEVAREGIAQIVASEGIVAWVNGHAEVGPRALGNRSLLADPRHNHVRERINEIKGRQWWRPVAPAILDSEGPRYFQDYRTSPFMALNFDSTALAKGSVPGVLHIDGSARIQSVTPEGNPALFEALNAFKDLTGIPLLGNTSLNDAGEPIINRLSEAVHFAAGKGIRSLVIDGHLVVRLRDARATHVGPLPRAKDLFGPMPGTDQAEILQRENPHNLNRQELSNYYDNPDLFDGIDIRRVDDARQVRLHTRAYLAKYPGALDRG